MELESSVTSMEDRLLAIAGSLMNSATLEDKRVLLVGFHGGERSTMREMLGAIGVRTLAVLGNVQALGSLRDVTCSFSIVIVNFDGFEDTEVGVDALIAFRASSVRSAVIICSSSVSDDDLTSHRVAICDSTLRLPGTTERLRRALLAGLENRLIFNGVSQC